MPKGVLPQSNESDKMEGSEFKDFAVHDRDGNVVETDIVFEEQIGKGAFGKVFKVRMKSGDKGPEDIYCLKMCLDLD